MIKKLTAKDIIFIVLFSVVVIMLLVNQYQVYQTIN